MKVQGTISIVGGESLLGRELRDLITERRLPIRVHLVGVDESSLTLTEQDGEPAVMTALDEESLSSSQVAVLAGSRASGRKTLDLLAGHPNSPALVDMTYVSEESPAARLRAPVVEPPDFQPPSGALHVIAHPAAVSLALFLLRLASEFNIRGVIAHIFEPASERGQKGLDELRKQTVSLLSFQSMPKDVFDAQAGFCMLARYGEEAPQALGDVELRIERHLASLLEGRATLSMPSLRLVHAPVFHGYTMSLRVEFEERPDLEAVAAALSSPQVDVRGGDLDPPNNVGIAGQDGISIGAISADRNHPNACWFWLAADNFRLMAENALTVVRSLLPVWAGER